jgi:hypothetical protein
MAGLLDESPPRPIAAVEPGLVLARASHGVPLRPHEAYGSELTRSDQLETPLIARTVTTLEPRLIDLPTSASELALSQSRIAILERDRHRLLAIHVLPGPQCQCGLSGVQIGRGCDEDGVDLIGCQKILVIRETPYIGGSPRLGTIGARDARGSEISSGGIHTRSIRTSKLEGLAKSLGMGIGDAADPHVRNSAECSEELETTIANANETDTDFREVPATQLSNRVQWHGTELGCTERSSCEGRRTDEKTPT